MNENTICPLISISVDDCFVPCQGERCAWYVPPVLAPNGGRLIAGHCAVRDLGALPELARGGETVSYYRTCPICGAYLDPCERCDCQDEKEAAASATNTDSGRVETGLQAQLSASSLHEDKGNCKNEPSRRT